MKHQCKEREELNEKYDYSITSSLGYGEAIGKIVFSEEYKIWHTDNDEYATIINFCPFCGIKL